MTAFPIWIPGTPIPQGSKNVSRTGHTYEANRKLRPWRQTMAAHLIAWISTHQGAFERYDGPLLVDVTFWMPQPKRPAYSLPAVKPDADKLARALGDALTSSGVIKDDARVTTWTIRKRYAKPGREGVTIHDIRADVHSEEGSR